MTEHGAWGGRIKTRHIADDVQDRLVTAVALGVYVPGQRLPTERELAAMLGVSRSSVRGALKELTETGYLEVRRGRNGGYFVLADWGPSTAEHVQRQLVDNWAEFEALFDARTLLEPLIARTAAERRTGRDVTAIEAALRAYLDAPDHDASRQADYALHHAIVSATHNPILVDLSVDLRARIGLNLGAEPYTNQVRLKAVEQHRQLVEAVTQGRAAAAAELAAEHFTLSEGLIRRLVRRAKAQSAAARRDAPDADGDRGSEPMTSRLAFVVRRVLLTVPALFVMSVLVFLIVRLVPGDPVRTMLGFRATEANVVQVRHQLGLDKPLLTQYLDFVGGILRGDLGTDIVSHESLATLLAQRLPVTFELTGLAMLLAVLVGVPLGIRAATGGRWTNRLTEGFVILGISIPDFWLGILLVLVFAANLVVLPPSGFVPFATDPVENLRYLVLPVLTLAIGEAAYILRTTRSAMTSVLDRPFVTFLRAKGISTRRIVLGHVLRNAAPSIVTVIGIQVGVLLGGAIIVETLFALPGVGRLVVTAITQRNYPTVQVGVLAIAVIFIVVSLVTDLIVGWLDPRVSDGGGT